MLAKTVEDAQQKVTDSLFALLFTPAAFFWLAGLAASASADGGRFTSLLNQFMKLSDAKLLLLGAAALAVVVFSGAAYEPMNGWFLQRLLGYWGPLNFLGAPLRMLLRKKNERLQREQNTRGTVEGNDAVKTALHYLPVPEQVVATEFGCALVASDRRIYSKYGLSADVCWTPLSYVLPDAARKAVADASGDIEASGRLLFWTLASLGWIAVAPHWPAIGIIVGVVAIVATFGYLRLVQQGRAYADAFEAAFDVGRASLYKALRLPLPECNDFEPERGRVLTTLVYRGYPSSGVHFTD